MSVDALLARAPITWEELCALEPQLTALSDHALNAKRGRNYCKYDGWYGFSARSSLKQELCAPVEWHRAGTDIPVLSTPEAYRIAYFAVFNALPPCACCARKRRNERSH
jgi:hypothetical protein